MASFRNCNREEPHDHTVGIYGERKTIGWCLDGTPPSTMETFGKKSDPRLVLLGDSGFSTEEDNDDDDDDDDDGDDDDDTKILTLA